MKEFYWIRGAMVAGRGILSVKALGRALFMATMTWKYAGRRREAKSGKACRNLEEALQSLDETLQEDAADEMVKKGAA